MFNQRMMKQMQGRLEKVQLELAELRVEAAVGGGVVKAVANGQQSIVSVESELSESVIKMREAVVFCSTCFHITAEDPCQICSDTRRDRTLLCVVEEPLDVMAFERTMRYRGLYHVLHGALSPVEGVGPDDLKI